jgi:ADP-heptose:LPS heptosyltransferase
MGDILMCTPALREVKRLNPACSITFYSGFPEVIRGLPFIDEVHPFAERPAHAILLACEGSHPAERHLACIFGDNLGVVVQDIRPSCALDQNLLTAWRERINNLPRPVIVVNRYANSWTPNKDWPDPFWVTLIGQLCHLGSVVEIGRPDPGFGCVAHPNYLDLRGRTQLPDLVALLAAADLHVGPISGPVHIAAAFAKPSVVVYGGFEHPKCSSYPGNIDLYTSLPCSPCWLKTPCPYNKECLRLISPARVFAAVKELWERERRIR